LQVQYNENLSLTKCQLPKNTGYLLSTTSGTFWPVHRQNKLTGGAVKDRYCSGSSSGLLFYTCDVKCRLVIAVCQHQTRL